MLDEYIPFSQQTCSVNSNFNLHTTGIRCPHASMCMDNRYMNKKFTSYHKNVTGNLGVVLKKDIENSEGWLWRLGGI